MINNRVISNFGVYKLSENERRSELRVDIQLQNKPTSLYENGKYPFPKTFLGYAQFCSRGTVIETKELSFFDQRIFTRDLVEIKAAIALYCVIPKVNQSPIVVDAVDFDRIRFQLYNNASIIVWVESLELINPCQAPISWRENNAIAPTDPENPNKNKLTIFPVDVGNPLGYTLGDPPYDGINDGGETYIAGNSQLQGTWTVLWKELTACLSNLTFSYRGIASETPNLRLEPSVSNPNILSYSLYGGNRKIVDRFCDQNAPNKRAEIASYTFLRD